jgi:hypothetical protein
MLQYKRNQIEEAISGVLEPRSPEPTSELRTRLKRLLETDRALGRVPRCADPERANFAFYSAEAPGSGVEVWFSEYEAFALLNGLRLMGHGWPQGFAVSVMRRGCGPSWKSSMLASSNRTQNGFSIKKQSGGTPKKATWRSIMRIPCCSLSFPNREPHRMNKENLTGVRYAEDQTRR